MSEETLFSCKIRSPQKQNCSPTKLSILWSVLEFPQAVEPILSIFEPSSVSLGTFGQSVGLATEQCVSSMSGLADNIQTACVPFAACSWHRCSRPLPSLNHTWAVPEQYVNSHEQSCSYMNYLMTVHSLSLSTGHWSPPLTGCEPTLISPS